MRKSRSAPDRVDALLTDAAQRQALVAVRALGRAGVRSCMVDHEPRAPAFASRWCVCSQVVPDFADDPAAFVAALVRLCAEHRPRALIPVHDGSVEALHHGRAELERVVGLALAPAEALAVAVDKARTLELARTLGLRVPRGVVVDDAAAAAAAVAEVGLPVVVKPTRTWVQGTAEGRRLRAVVAETPTAVIAAARELLAQGSELVLQEWLPGDREALSFICANGRIWARFAQRADRTFPPLGGNSVLRESIPLPDDIAAGAERLVLELGLDGYSEVEFRRDARGRAALMEINPRLSASVEIAERSGVPFPTLLYRWASGEPMEEVSSYRVGGRMRWLGGDLPWLEEVLRGQGQPDVPPRATAVRAFLGDFFKPMSYDYLDRGDLRPALAAAGGAVRQLQWRAGRFRRSAPRRLGQSVSQRRAGSQGTGAPAVGVSGLDTDVAVIGAGPYGLAIAAHLRAAEVRHEIFGETMDTWRAHMPKGMLLKSEGYASNISDARGEHTLERYCAELGIEYGALAVPIALQTFSDYGCWFQERAVPGLRRTQVELVERVAGGFQLRLDSGETLRAGRVVVANGMQGYAYLPPVLDGLPAGKAIHCYDCSDPSASRGAEIAVLGAGQSALEAAALIHEQGGRPHVVLRGERVAWNSKPGGSARPLRERLRYPASGLGEGMEQWLCANVPLAFHAAPPRVRTSKAYAILGPAGAWWLRPRIEEHIDVKTGLRLLEARSEEAGGVRLRLQGPAEVEELVVDQVVAGTGYRADVERLTFLDAALRRGIATLHGAPVLDRAFESSVPDLYFVGYAAAVSFGPLMRFVFGTDYTARRLARRFA